MPPPKIRRASYVSVGDFFDRHQGGLQLELLGDNSGFKRRIIEPTVNRPGLALSGFYNYFAWKRVQVIGAAESSYLNNLGAECRHVRLNELCERKIPCVVVSRNKKPPEGLLEITTARNISVFRSPMVTMDFINAATILLEEDFAPSTTEHGTMIDMRGIGILVRGASGLGKSESVLGMIERGASLVADDMVRFRLVEHEVIGEPAEIGRFHMEVRGIGIINVAAVFGVGSIRAAKRLDLVATLKPASEVEALAGMDRLGLERKQRKILDFTFPEVQIPVAPGRDIARLIEVAALDQKLRAYGHETAVEFDKNLLKTLQDRRIK